MRKGDYIEKKVSINKRKKSLEKIIKSNSNIEYALKNESEDSLGRGGAGKVRTVIRVLDGKEMAFKELVYTPENKVFIDNLKENIAKLIQHPIKSIDENINKSIILPLDLIELKESKSFGYVMEKVDTTKYITLPELNSSGIIPDAKILAIICKNVASIFHEIHSQMAGYKDINDGNILIDFNNGDIRLIDCENISTSSYEVIFGTIGFIAPEVFKTNHPNIRSDQHSMAVFFFKLLVDGHPLEGKKAIDYMNSNELTISEAANVIYGDEALFIFDEEDDSNSIKSLARKDSGFKNIYFRWAFLPKIIKECFQETFSKGLKIKELRTVDSKWMDRFNQVLEDGLVKCPSCGRYNFKDSQIKNSCFFCKSALNIESEEDDSKNDNNISRPVQFKFKAQLRNKSGILNVGLKNPVSGEVFNMRFPDYAFIITESNGSYFIANPSRFNIEITDDKNKVIIKPNERYPLKENIEINIFDGKLILTYLGES